MDRIYLIRPVLAALLLLVGLAGTCTESQQAGELLIRGQTMGTSYQVTLALSPEQPVDRDLLRQEIEALLERVNQQMSTYRDDSEITLFNRYQGTEWFGISSEFAEVLEQALEIARLSGGAFDVTVAPLVDLWGFGRIPGNEIPSASEVETVLSEIGYKKLHVRSNPPSVRKENPSLQCDLSGIAKGYAVDQVGLLLEGLEIEDYLVEIGGEVRCRGSNVRGDQWQIGIDSPESPGSIQRVVRLSGLSLATSGDYNNYFEVDGVRYSHTIDPLTGRPVAHDLASVSVLHTSCMRADALATAINVLGPEKGLAFAKKHDLAVLLLERSGTGLEETSTPPMARLFLSTLEKRE